MVGAREWNGVVIDVPVMGYDGNPESTGYCVVGDTPEFKLYRPGTDELIDLTGEISSWANNATTFVGSLENLILIPDNLFGYKLFGLGAYGAALALLFSVVYRYIVSHVVLNKLIGIKYNHI